MRPLPQTCSETAGPMDWLCWDSSALLYEAPGAHAGCLLCLRKG